MSPGLNANVHDHINANGKIKTFSDEFRNGVCVCVGFNSNYQMINVFGAEVFQHLFKFELYFSLFSHSNS